MNNTPLFTESLSSLGGAWAPILPLWVYGAFIIILLSFALYTRSFNRVLIGTLLLCAASNISLIKNSYTPAKSSVLLIIDESPSNSTNTRKPLRDAAKKALYTKLRHYDENITVIEKSLKGHTGSDLTNLQHIVKSAQKEQLSAIFMLTDTNFTHLPTHTNFLEGTPLHIIKTTHKKEYDHKITLLKKPQFALLGQEQEVIFTVDAPQTEDVPITFYIGGTSPQQHTVQTNTEITLKFTLTSAGQTALKLTTPHIENDPIPQNNTAVFLVNGVREALNVLLVSGVPHNGAQALRQLLKSDPALNMVHFTILRTSARADPTPDKDLALIPFPVEDLFGKDLQKFDLIIFDRYINRGFLPYTLFGNIIRHVRSGAGLFVIAGPEFESPFELPATPLQSILPVKPTGPEQQHLFTPKLTKKGQEHPIFTALHTHQKTWGAWASVLPAAAVKGHTLLQTPKGQPLLTISEEGQGRVATLLSNNWWFWPRGVYGGGPHQTLIRNTFHWLLKQPELEEAQLHLTKKADMLNITYKGLQPEKDILATLTPPNGTTQPITLKKAEGFTTQHPYTEDGLYTLTTKEGLNTYAILGKMHKEWATPFNQQETTAFLKKLKASTTSAQDLHTTALRLKPNTAHKFTGPNWLGLRQQNIKNYTGTKRIPLLPYWGWATILLSLLFTLWAYESKRK